MNERSLIYLIDPPTFPKGVISLSFPAVAACLPPRYKIQHIDLNLEKLSAINAADLRSGKCLFAGIKVSSQNYRFAIDITSRLKKIHSDIVIIWGGEYPSLLPEEASKYADVVVSGMFEPVCAELISDLENGNTRKIYSSKKNYDCSTVYKPDYSIIHDSNKYLLSMGVPMETSRGCDKRCTFCMVHTMQPVNNFKTPEQLEHELASLKGMFVNVVDYNIGSNRKHLDNVIRAFSNSEAQGWMGEMCLETLDDDELLERLAESGCRVIYCGLESVSETGLRSVNKAKTNNITNYERIIRKVQSHGVQIAAGIIIGLEEANTASINDTFRFFSRLGLLYAKITFLTFNPGTKVHESMKRVGEYNTSDHERFDGNHFTFLHRNVNEKELIEALVKNIRSFYSLKNIRRRAFNSGHTGAQAEAFLNFNLVYRDPYLKWLKYNVFEDESGFRKLLETPFRKTARLAKADIAGQWKRNFFKKEKTPEKLTGNAFHESAHLEKTDISF